MFKEFLKTEEKNFGRKTQRIHFLNFLDLFWLNTMACGYKIFIIQVFFSQLQSC